MAWAPNYIEAEALADFVHTDVESDRVELEGACASASRAIDLATYRQFGVTASESRFYTAEWSTKKSMWVFVCDDFTAITAIAVDTAGDGTYATTVDPSALVYYPLNNAVKGLAFESAGVRRSALPSAASLGHGAIRATAEWGWTNGFPEGIVSATKLQASRFFARRNSPYGVAGSPDQGSEIRLQAKADPDVKLSVQYFKRAVWLS